MALVFDDDVSWADAGNPRTADLAGAKRIEQDRESCEVERVLRPDADQRDLVFELAQLGAGRDDRRGDAEHV
jgi:hypothetical protein